MEDEIKKLLEKNLKLAEETHKMVRSIKSYMFWQNVWGFLKILIIVVPIVIGIIYLPPLIKDVFRQYQSLLGGEGGLNSESGSGSLLENFLKSGGGIIPAELEKKR
ncbi:MAG: hypothetical protein PHR36_05665 [Patescibacteria group bacterium]|nr:hypothetical protein [Patescibacteria group bacterium]